MRDALLRVIAPCAAALLLAIPRAAPAQDPSRPASASDLAAALRQIVSRTALGTARAGIMVSSLETGDELFVHAPDELLNPASNVKLFTAAAALARLGPEYRFETEVSADREPAAGAIQTLYVKGKGDPSLVTERLWALAADLDHRGVKMVKGDLVVDDTFFDAVRDGPGFDQERGDRSYLAPAGALSLNYNNVAIHVAPGDRVGARGRVELEPASDFFALENRTTTARASARRRVTPSSVALDGRQRIAIAGQLPLRSRTQVMWRKIDDPPLYFGYTLKRLLELRGVKVLGKVRRGTVPADARLLHVEQSEPLADIVRKLDKSSNNFIAEQILKTLGAEVKGPPGTWPKGVDAVEEVLAGLGIPRGGYVMRNGSGLNDANRFSARQTVVLLREMWKRFPLMVEFVGSLPVAGKDGTLRWRMEGTEAVGRLRAKTGTLEGVSSLSGYVETAKGERLVFAVLVNDFAGRTSTVVRAIDALGGALAAAGGPASELGAAVARSAQPPAAGAHADQKALVATYYRLGRAADPRNLPFLRTALRTEADPALRMAAAEAVYLSDPDGESARRTFLENLFTEGDALGRLRALAAEGDGVGPVLGSLADLASEGSPDALSRLVELAPVVAGSTLDSRYGDTLAEVGGSAPRELLLALRAAPAAAADAALTALAGGLARGQDPQHLFAANVKQAAAGPDAELAAFARALAARLEERVAAARAAPRPSPTPAVEPPITPAAAETRPGGG